MARLSVISIALLALSGCASAPSYDYDKFRAATVRHDCPEAEVILKPAAQKGDANAIANLGWVYAYCYGDKRKAIPYYTLAAREGYGPARMRLVDLGAPVPPADLAAEDHSGEAAAAFATGLAQGFSDSAPTHLNCLTTGTGGYATTNCH